MSTERRLNLTYNNSTELSNKLTAVNSLHPGGYYNNNNNNDRLTAFDPGQPG